MLTKIRQWILDTFYPFIVWMGKVHMPYSKKKVTANMVEDILKIIEPGHVLVSTTYGELSNLFIPGKFRHAAIYVGNGRVVEAIGIGVRNVSIYQFCMTKDLVVLLDNLEANHEQMQLVVTNAISCVGKPYDYDFWIPHEHSNSKVNEAFYCAELVWYCYKQACPNMEFKLRQVMGARTVIPDDFVNANKYWQKLWCSDKVDCVIKK